MNANSLYLLINNCPQNCPDISKRNPVLRQINATRLNVQRSVHVFGHTRGGSYMNGRWLLYEHKATYWCHFAAQKSLTKVNKV